ncbi:MAG TPA: glycosyl hydrolase [Lacunisphaera sp.]|nr:glycosyl hydrolase [Lacunisphaera sp.]
MIPRSLVAAAALLLPGATLMASAQPPADPGLNERGRAVLAYFQALRASPDFKLLSGQFAGWSGQAKLEELGRIQQATGRWPALIGLDYCRWNHDEADIGVDAPNDLARAYWNAGGLVTISWHAFNPANPAGGGLRDKGVDIAGLLAEGTPTHQRWIAGLDRIAAGLAELQRDGVVVLWRPLHEMNGGWFWWGAQKPADFVAVWRQMFDYFTRVKGLHNLLWVYGPNHGPNAAGYYPGDAYVDIVGLDAYTDFVDPEHIHGFPALAAIDKPVGLAEFGPHGADHPPGDFDYRRLVDGLARNFPAARFFMSWNAKWNPAENKFAREFYQDPRIITRESLLAGLAGAAPVADAAYVKSIEDWRAARVARLTKPDGWLSLVGLHQLAPGLNTVGTAEDNSIRLAAGPPYLCSLLVDNGRVLLNPAAAALFEIDGSPAQKAELVYQGDRPTTVTFGTASFYVIPRGDRLYLRVKDRASARRANFAGLDYFPIDPTWRIEAQWVPFDPPRQVNIANVLGQSEPAAVPGKAVFTRAGRTFELLAIDEGAGEPLFFVITDLTAGEETYEASRFVYADRPKDGKLVLDFNQAYNPPCAFTPFATCPLPPKENRMNIRVTAGEKKYRGKAD